MKKALLFSLLIGFVLLGCNKENEAAVPTCIQDRLQTFDMNEACSDGASVERHMFQGNPVYLFNPGACTVDSIEVRSDDCALLGYLGGLLNNSDINGVDFYLSSQYDAIVWQN